MSDGRCRAGSILGLAFALLGLIVPSGTNATTVAPVPCEGALPLYTKIGVLANVDGSHRRAADVEGRLAVLRQGRGQTKAVRVGWAYVDGEGDVWVAIANRDARATRDWRHVAPGIGTHSPVYALIERVGIPKGYRLSACSASASSPAQSGAQTGSS